MSTKLTNSLGLLAIILGAFVGGHVFGFAAATDYYKVQYPDEN